MNQSLQRGARNRRNYQKPPSDGKHSKPKYGPFPIPEQPKDGNCEQKKSKSSSASYAQNDNFYGAHAGTPSDLFSSVKLDDVKSTAEALNLFNEMLLQNKIDNKARIVEAKSVDNRLKSQYDHDSAAARMRAEVTNMSVIVANSDLLKDHQNVREDIDDVRARRKIERDSMCGALEAEEYTCNVDKYLSAARSKAAVSVAYEYNHNKMTEESFNSEEMYLVKEESLRQKMIHLRRTEVYRNEIARMLFTEDDIRQNGPKAKKSVIRDKIVYLSHGGPGSGMLCPTNVALDMETRERYGLRLIQVPLFYNEPAQSWGRWISRILMKPFYSRYSTNEVDRYCLEQDLDAEHAIPFYEKDDPFYGNRHLNKCFDLSKKKSLLGNFRFLGFEANFIRVLFLSSNDFFVRNNFNCYRSVYVHPGVYSCAHTIAIGKKVTDVLVNQIVCDLKEWLEYIPSDVLVDSVAAACQAADVINSSKDSSFRQVRIEALTN